MRRRSYSVRVPHPRQRPGVRTARKVLIAQHLFDGHRLMFVSLLTREARERGDEPVWLLADGALESGEYAEHLADAAEGVRVVVVPVVDAPAVRRVADEVDADLVILPDGDLYLPPLLRGGWDRARALSVLVMRPDGQPSPNRAKTEAATVAKRLLRTAVRARTGAAVHVLVNGLRPTVRGHEVRDPILIESAEPARLSLEEVAGVAGGRYWFGVVGAVTPRKNLHLIAAALRRLDPSRVGLAVAGRCDPTALALAMPEIEAFQAAGGAVVLRDELVSDETFESVLASVDCAVVAHSNEGASGVLVRAAVFGTRVVAAGARSLRRDAEELPEVATWVPLDVDDLAHAFSAALSSPRPVRVPMPAERPLGSLLGRAAEATA